jgi:hypothetical protein
MRWYYIGVKPILFFENSIPMMRSVHVFVYQSNWHNKVDIKIIDDVNQQAKKYDECCILVVSELNIHGPKFNSPSN